MTAKEMFERLKKGEKINVFDIRTKTKFDNFHLAGAINLAKAELINSPSKFLSEDKKYYVVCNGGNSSMFVELYLKSQGYDIKSVHKGMNPLLRFLGK